MTDRVANAIAHYDPGRAMETMDRDKMCKLVYPHALRAAEENRFSVAVLSAAIAATADGYAFPTNLDRDPPTNGLAPETQAAFFKRAVSENLEAHAFAERLDQMREARKA